MNMNLFDTTSATALNVGPGLIVDNFCGGGGASTGIEQALGRAVDIAINHDEEAIRMHEANHPGTHHVRNNIWQIDPVEVTGGKPVELAWFSPDCKHFSKAKGGKPREKSIRDLAWIVVLWAQRVRPSLILLENVEEFRTWGPLDDEGQPIKERQGETFEEWTKQLRKEGYRIQWKELRACDYGAPTIRKRFFMIARCDGLPIVWPKPTHGKPGSPDVVSGKLKPWRSAADIIDWSVPCPSIFERDRPLAEKTLRRIAHGIMKFVVNNPSPFIVPLEGSAPFFARTAHGDIDKNGKRRGQPCHGPEDPFPTVTQSQDSALITPFISPVKSWSGGGNEARDIELPLRTTTTSKGGEHAVIVPHVTKFRSGAIGSGADEPVPTVTANSYIKRPGGAAPLGRVDAVLAPFSSYAQQGGGNRNIEEPHHTICANVKDQNCVVGAHMIRVGNGEREGQEPRAVDAELPLHTVVAQRNNHALVEALMERMTAAHIEQANGGPNNETLAGRAADDPLSTVTQAGSQQRVVTSHLMKMRGTCAHGQPVEEPAPTLTSGGNHVAEVRAFLYKYYGNEEGGHGIDDPLGTVTTKDRFGLVTVTIGGEEYVIVDIGMRMLTPRELFNAQGFPGDYIIEHDAQGRPTTKTAQVSKCGNSVCPPLSRALVAENAPSLVGQPELPVDAAAAA